ncbi:MAG: M1 family aminopeptidase [Acidobacteriota bacterium]
MTSRQCNRLCWLLVFLACSTPAPPVLAQQGYEGSPAIDVESYAVEAHLSPSTNGLRAKASVRFSALQNGLTSVAFEFNPQLQISQIYLADNPPKPGAQPPPPTVTSSGASRSSRTPEGEVPVLTRRAGQRRPSAVADSNSRVAGSDPALLSYRQGDDELGLTIDLPAPLSKGQSTSVVVEYEANLKSTQLYLLEGVQLMHVSEDVSYLLSLGRWFPIHRYLVDRATASFRITVPKDYIVAMDATAGPKESMGSEEVFTFSNQSPGFSGSLSVARYNVLPVTAGGVQVTFYVRDNKRDFVPPHTEALGKILELYSSKLGSYPFAGLKIAVIDNKSLLGFAAQGMEFLAERAFDASPNVGLLSREIAYQWWQNLITPKTGRDLWLKEGLAAYSALLYEESISSAEGFGRQLKETAVAALVHEDKSTIAEAYLLPLYSPEYNSILKSKGAYVVHMLRGVLGDENFFKMLKEYVYNFGYKEASISDLKQLAEKTSGQDLTYFFAQWIIQSGVPEFTYDYTTLRVKDGFRVTGVIKQDLDTFKMPVQIEIETDGKPEMQTVEVVGSESQFSVPTFGKPIRARLDPFHKILRISEDSRVATFIAKGDELRRLGEPAEAIAEYQKAIELNRRSSLGYYRIGESFFEQRSYQSAANSFREALNGDLEPRWIEVWCHINLGKLFDVLGQRERALKEYQQAIDTNDNTQGAQDMAQRYIREPYKYEGRTVLIQ